MADEEIVDPLAVKREKCSQEPKCVKLKLRLDKCTARVNKVMAKDEEPTETCFEEIIDFVNCVDHCAMHGLFSKLK